MRIAKAGNAAHFRKLIRTHHSAQSTCRPAAILIFTMWSSCPVECECTNCNLYFDVCCNSLTPPPKIKTWKIAPEFVNMPSSTSSSIVDLVNFSTSLHAKSPVPMADDVNFLEFSIDLHDPPTMSSSVLVCQQRPSRRQSSCPRHLHAAMIVPVELPWIFTSVQFDVPSRDETMCKCAMCIKHTLDPTPSPKLPSPVVLPSPVGRPLPVTRPLPVARPSAAVTPAVRVQAPFDTPDVSCFACSPWGQHGIAECRKFSSKCRQFNVSYSSNGSSVASAAGSSNWSPTSGTPARSAGWRTAGALRAKSPTTTHSFAGERTTLANL